MFLDPWLEALTKCIKLFIGFDSLLDFTLYFLFLINFFLYFSRIFKIIKLLAVFIWNFWWIKIPSCQWHANKTHHIILIVEDRIVRSIERCSKDPFGKVIMWFNHYPASVVFFNVGKIVSTLNEKPTYLLFRETLKFSILIFIIWICITKISPDATISIVSAISPEGAWLTNWTSFIVKILLFKVKAAFHWGALKDSVFIWSSFWFHTTFTWYLFPATQPTYFYCYCWKSINEILF